jgi:hypothetical protein
MIHLQHIPLSIQPRCKKKRRREPRRNRDRKAADKECKRSHAPLHERTTKHLETRLIVGDSYFGFGQTESMRIEAPWFAADSLRACTRQIQLSSSLGVLTGQEGPVVEV